MKSFCHQVAELYMCALSNDSPSTVVEKPLYQGITHLKSSSVRM